MSIFSTESSEPYVIDIEAYDDDRGFLIPLTNELSPNAIRRVYVVGNFARGTIRGFHLHHRETKMFYIIKGAAKFVAIDIENPERICTFIISERKPKIVVIPPGYANGWMSLTDDTLLVSMSSRTYKEVVRDKDDIRFNPYKWGDVWRIDPR